ncbi:MAG: hemerythrin family protein [Chloroherpetonaceae bacterium]|nr:hemerythrin family protein [Chloroherpetonaceae bacterium]MDW8438313.1 hemerythrin family protein [Chloroherpetonaceae bacterium]
MKRFEWTPALSTGVAFIDAQHKELIRAINDLGDDLQRGQGASAIQQTVSFLKYYAEWHFGQEEDCAAKHQCPIAETNKQAHGQFMKMLDKLSADLRQTSDHESVAKEAHHLLCDWFEGHIMKIDKQIGDHVTKCAAAS